MVRWQCILSNDRSGLESGNFFIPFCVITFSFFLVLYLSISILFHLSRFLRFVCVNRFIILSLTNIFVSISVSKNHFGCQWLLLMLISSWMPHVKSLASLKVTSTLVSDRPRPCQSKLHIVLKLGWSFFGLAVRPVNLTR